MKQLYRIAYERPGGVAGITFSAADTIAAVEFSELWEHLCGVKVLTLKPLGSSKIQPRPYGRTSRSLTGVPSSPPEATAAGGLGSPLPATEVVEQLSAAEQFQLEISKNG